MTKFDVEIVGKVGSMALINPDHDDMDYNIICRIGRFLRPGTVWVTSGAAEIGRLDYVKRAGRELEGEETDVKSDYAAQGQSLLMTQYRQFVDARYGLRQILVEHQHFNDPLKREHLRKLLLRAVAQSAIPIVNYNDPVSDEEVRKMEIRSIKRRTGRAAECVDNDETASQIACLVKPRILVILTGVDGIYADRADKSSLIREIRGATVEETVANIDRRLRCCAGASRAGASGARAKLEYVKDPIRNGTTVFIGNSRYGISDIIEGRAPSTKICVG